MNTAVPKYIRSFSCTRWIIQLPSIRRNSLPKLFRRDLATRLDCATFQKADGYLSNKSCHRILLYQSRRVEVYKRKMESKIKTREFSTEATDQFYLSSEPLRDLTHHCFLINTTKDKESLQT